MLVRAVCAFACSMGLIAGVQFFRTPAAGARSAAAPAGMRPPADGKKPEFLYDLEDNAKDRDSFYRFGDRLNAALLDGTITLHDATERLFWFCLQTYPLYLDNLCNIEPGRHIKSKVAQNLVRGVRLTADRPDVVARLEQELRDLPYEEEASRAVAAQ